MSKKVLLPFKDISFKLGSNSHLVQAAGGNTSIKSDGRMLIKASGTWLINSLDKDIFVEVDLNSITEKINNGKEDNFRVMNRYYVIDGKIVVWNSYSQEIIEPEEETEE